MSDPPVAYRSAPSIAWVQERSCVLVVDPDRGRSWHLSDAEAAIWDWLTLGYPYEQVARQLAVLLDVPGADAARALRSTLLAWESEGIVQPVDGTAHG